MDNKKKNNSLLYIAIVTSLLILGTVIFFVVKTDEKESDKKAKNNTNATASAPKVVHKKGNEKSTMKGKISLSDEKGHPNKTVDKNTKISFQNIKLGQSFQKIKEMEKDSDTTLGDPQISTSEDGYTYLTYKFNTTTTPNLFGTDILTTSNSSMLVYVFYQDKLIEVRIQYGAIGTNGYNSIIQYCTDAYGAPTYSRSYSNGATQSWWKTKKNWLDVILQNNEVTVYYRANN